MLRAVVVAALFLAGCYAQHGSESDAGHAVDAPPDAIGPLIEATLRDTLGYGVTVTYREGSRLESGIEGHHPVPIECPPGDIADGTLEWNSRVLVVTTRCSNRYMEIYARPVMCDTTSDCEPALGFLRVAGFDPTEIPSRTECVHGLCELPDQPVSRQDLYALCLAEMPRWPEFSNARSEASGYVALRELVSDHCREPECTVPEACRQP